jgi:hypothetical protein
MLFACENIDRLQCMELQGRALPRGLKAALYEVARAAHDEPLVLAAAKLLQEGPRHIGIVTGAAVPGHMPLGENDGPFGATVLAKALLRLGHWVSIYTDNAAAGPLKALIERLEIDVPVIDLQMNDKDQQLAIAEDLDVAVAIERTGGNGNGIIYGATGVSRADFRCNVDHLFRTATALGKPTLSIADGGNEIGFGKVYEALCARMPEYKLEDVTPCGGGVYSVVPTDVLVVATSSNLGAYGVVATLALLRDDISICHTPEEEIALEYIGVGLGLTDGGSGARIAAVDGVPVDDNAAIVRLMRSSVQRALEGTSDRGF